MTADMTVIRGDTHQELLTVTDANGAAFNLTDAVIWFTVKARKSRPDNEALIQHRSDVGDAIEILDAVEGEARHTLTADETEDLDAPKSYYFDYQVVESDGRTTTIEIGTLQVLEDITLTRV